MGKIGVSNKSKRNPNGITKVDSDALLKRDFKADKPFTKCVTDISEITGSDGKFYVSAIYDCFDVSVVGLALDTNIKATLCENTLDNACKAYLSKGL